MKRWHVVAALSLLLAAPAMAQTIPQAEVFGGYSYIRDSGENIHGWNGAFGGTLNNRVSVTGDFSGHYKTISGVDLKLHAFTVGPQLSYRTETFTAFARGLFGGARASASSGGISVSENGFAMNFGGGIDWNAGEKFSVRVIQFDSLSTRLGGSWTTDPRLSFGVVFRIGQR